MERPRRAGASRRIATGLAPLVLALVACLVLASSDAQALIPRCGATVAPPGWSAPIVPRITGDAVDTLAVTMPPVLVGGGTTYLNWASSSNHAARGGWTDRLSLDGVPVQTLVRPLDTRWQFHYFRSVNQGPTVVRGGRHTLQQDVDVDWESGEDYNLRYDNSWSAQWVWSPEAFPWKQIVWNRAAPQRGSGTLPNCDGLSLTRPAGSAWCVAIGGTGLADLTIYDDYVDANNGFSHALATSASATDGIEFVVGHGAGTPATVFSGVTSGIANAGDRYSLSTSDAATRTGNASSDWSDVLLPGYQMAELYSLHLEAGVRVALRLTRLQGVTPLACAVFPAGSGGVFSRGQALGASTPLDASTATLDFTPPETGDYPVVVHRTGLATLSEGPYYRLQFQPPLDVTDAPLALALASPAPNPVRDASRMSFALPSAGHVRLALLDAQGRRVRTLLDSPMPAGSHAITWDARDDSGGLVPAGRYWLKLETPDGTRTQAVTVAR